MKYLLRSSNPLKYQLKSTVLYSLVYWKPSTALAASPFALSLAAAICSSFSLVHSRSTLSSSVKVRNFSLAWLASSIVAMSSFLCFEFSASKDDAWDRADSTLVSEARYSEVMWRLSPSTGIKIKGVHNLLKKKKKKGDREKHARSEITQLPIRAYGDNASQLRLLALQRPPQARLR